MAEAGLRPARPAHVLLVALLAVLKAIRPAQPAELDMIGHIGGRKLLQIAPAGSVAGLSLEFNVDRNGIGPNIREKIAKEAQVTREAFFKNLVSTVYYYLNGSYNVLAANIDHDYTWQNQQGTILYAFGVYQNIPFGVWTFTSGNFINRGSDDPSNWAFLGRYTTNGTNNISFKQTGDTEG